MIVHLSCSQGSSKHHHGVSNNRGGMTGHGRRSMCRYYTVPPLKEKTMSIKHYSQEFKKERVRGWNEKQHEWTLTSSLKENKCGFHQKTFRVGEVGKGWAESTPRTALTGLCASLKSLQLWEMGKSLKAMEETQVLWSCLEITLTKKSFPHLSRA